MSVYFIQNSNISNFSGSDSWVVLSQIEKQIKKKIEKIGTPLKDWDIQINYGIKTGFNDAFIITGQQRRELIDLDPKSEEIIRPILRGRDIKRYGYDFADLYLISTFPSLQIDIEQYPAIKSYLLSFGKELLIKNGYNWVAENYLSDWCFKRLEQTGSEIYINGQKISFANNTHARKKTNNKWYETQDAISYWDDFSKQKIVWGNLNLEASFAIAPEGIFVNAPSPMIVPANKYILAVLNSKIADYYIRSLGVTRNGGYFEYKPMFVEKLPIPLISVENQNQLITLVEDISFNTNKHLQVLVDNIVYKIYNLTYEEIKYIESQ